MAYFRLDWYNCNLVFKNRKILMLQIIKISLLISFLFTFSGCFMSVKHPEPHMNTQEQAINGYDVVAYTQLNKAVKGDTNITFRYKSLDWYFISTENRDNFRDNPEDYLPAFGGYCTYELSRGSLVNADPQYWHIHNDQVFLFSNEDAKEDWFRDISVNLPASKAHWTEINELTDEEKEEKMAQDFMYGTFY